MASYASLNLPAFRLYIETSKSVTNSGAAALLLPAFVLDGAGAIGSIGDASLNLPAICLSASNLGGIALPAFKLDADGVAGATTKELQSIALPAFKLDASVATGHLAHISLAIPAVELSASGGSEGADFGIPALLLSASGFSGVLGSANQILPAFRLMAGGEVEGFGAASLTLPRFALSAFALAGVSGSSGIALRPFVISASGHVGVVGTADLILPALLFGSSGYVESVGSAALQLPMVMLYADGESALGDFSTFAMNVSRHGLTSYTNFAFNSYAAFGEQIIAASSSGLFILGGSKDVTVDISAKARTGLSDFGSEFSKRVGSAYIGYRADGNAVLTVLTNEDEVNLYSLEPRQYLQAHTSRVNLGKGVKGRYWQIEFANENGSDFELDQVTLVGAELRRKV